MLKYYFNSNIVLQLSWPTHHILQTYKNKDNDVKMINPSKIIFCHIHIYTRKGNLKYAGVEDILKQHFTAKVFLGNQFLTLRYLEMKNILFPFPLFFHVKLIFSKNSSR